ncbi:hypothetical protein ACLOJK_033514 [Asimina triloba]
MANPRPPQRMLLGLLFFSVIAAFCFRVSLSARSDKEIRERFYGNLSLDSAPPDSGEGSIAKMFDRVLEKEFSDGDQPEVVTYFVDLLNSTFPGPDTSNFNSSVADEQVGCIRDWVHYRNLQYQNVRVVSVGKLTGICFLVTCLHFFKQCLCRFISDLVVVIVSATIGGITFSCLGQPVIVGYLLAGSIIGPGGLSFISEMVQVETVAQFGVVFLLFALGLEFSLTKFCGAKLSEGIFVGAFLSMSSTAVVSISYLPSSTFSPVSKFLVEKNSTNVLHGQVTIGTLILQLVGVIHVPNCCFFFVLVICSSILEANDTVIISTRRFHCVLYHSPFVEGNVLTDLQTNELYQLASVAFCLLLAWCSDKLGLSLELGSFVAGMMISTTDFGQHTLDQVEPIRNLFAALFLSSIGMLIHVQFLWNHVDILLASVILVVVVKTAAITVVTKAFGYSIRTSFLVGVLLAQIGEFAFVLLSRASNLHLVEVLFSSFFVTTFASLFIFCIFFNGL